MHDVLQGSSVALILRVGGAVLALAFNLVLTRLLGAEGAGIYFLALTIVFPWLGLASWRAYRELVPGGPPAS